jgi:hypothetical protein
MRVCILTDMDVTEVLADVRARLATLEAERAELFGQRDKISREIARVEETIRELGSDEQVLRRIAARYHLEVPHGQPLPREIQEWRELPRTVAIERVLKEAKHPLSPADVAHQLAANGREDIPQHVSAALAHLKNTGRAQQLGRGQWVHADTGGAAETSAEELTVTVDGSGADERGMVKPTVVDPVEMSRQLDDEAKPGTAGAHRPDAPGPGG